MKTITKILISAFTLLTLASCGGGGSSISGEIGGDGEIHKIGAFKGAENLAECTLYDINGNVLVAMQQTEDNGLKEFEATIPTGIVRLTCENGTYTDEATGATSVAGITMNAFADYQGGALTLIATPLSEMAYNLVGGANPTEDSIAAANTQIAAQFGLGDDADITDTIPTNITGGETAGNDEAGRLALVLAGVSQLIADNGGSATTVIGNMTDDIVADGTLNTTTFDIEAAIGTFTTSGSFAASVDIATGVVGSVTSTVGTVGTITVPVSGTFAYTATTININSTINTVTTVAGLNPGSGTLTYVFTTSTPTGISIDSTSGVITINTQTTTLDTYNIGVEVSSTDGGKLNTTATITVISSLAKINDDDASDVTADDLRAIDGVSATTVVDANLAAYQAALDAEDPKPLTAAQIQAVIDKVNNTPKVITATLSSNNALGLGYVKVGDEVTLEFTTDLDINTTTPTVVILGQSATVSRADNKSFTATYTVSGDDTEGSVSFTISSYTSTAGETGADYSDTTTDSSSLVFDKTAPVITDNFTTQNENDNNLNTGGVSMDATDALSGILDNSYSKTADVNVDNAAITVGVSDGLVNFASGFYPDYETKQTLTFELQVSDKAGNIGTNTVELTITDLVEASIVDVVYVANDERYNPAQNSLYVFFSEDMNSSTISENDLTDYTGSLTSMVVVDQGEYISTPTASATRFAHVLRVTNNPTIATTDNLELAVARDAGGAMEITPTNASPMDASAQLVYGTESFDSYGNTYTAVVSPHSLRVWHSKNLGAQQVATKANTDDDGDYLSYGSLFQWGRAADGHELMNWTAFDDIGAAVNVTDGGGADAERLATNTATVGHSLFIEGDNAPYDWVDPTASDGANYGNGAERSANWFKTDGTSICPIGYRVPTDTELEADTLLDGQTWTGGVDVRPVAFNNFLKLPIPDSLSRDSGVISNISKDGYYWSGSFSGSEAHLLSLDDTDVRMGSNVRAYGFSVRCIKD
jgi:uncharacterized protein (TIGR02145 family)